MKTDTVNKNKIENNMNENDEYLYIKSINKEKLVDTKDICIICIVTLDIDENANLFKNKIETILFNVYEFNTIRKVHKDKFFLYGLWLLLYKLRSWLLCYKI